MAKESFRILTLNNISVRGLERLPRERYEVASEIGHPDAILLRSADMHSSSYSIVRTFALTVFALGLVAMPAGCSDDEDDKKNDSAASCTSLCTGAGFSAGRADVQPNEINCFCTGGSGVVTASACKSMCDGLGRATSAPFGGSAGAENACQCE